MEENKKPQNLNAFPTRTEYEDPTNPIYSGMTLRDYFAAKAISEIPLKISERYVNDSDYDEWAKKCYRRADALLKQREL